MSKRDFVSFFFFNTCLPLAYRWRIIGHLFLSTPTFNLVCKSRTRIKASILRWKNVSCNPNERYTIVVGQRRHKAFSQKYTVTVSILCNLRRRARISSKTQSKIVKYTVVLWVVTSILCLKNNGETNQKRGRSTTQSLKEVSHTYFLTQCFKSSLWTGRNFCYPLTKQSPNTKWKTLNVQCIIYRDYFQTGETALAKFRQHLYPAWMLKRTADS